MQPPAPAALDPAAALALARARRRVGQSCHRAAWLVGIMGVTGVAMVVYAASLPNPPAAAAHNVPLAASALVLGGQVTLLTRTFRGWGGGGTSRAARTADLCAAVGHLYETASNYGSLLVIVRARTLAVLGWPAPSHWHTAVTGVATGAGLILVVLAGSKELDAALKAELALGPPPA